MKRRLLLDQMLDTQVAAKLAALGHDVVRLAQIGMSRAIDASVLAQAIGEKRVLITLDEHFGDWAILPLSTHYGVVRVKANPACTANILSVLVPFLDKHAGRDVRNMLIIVRSSGVRWIDTAAGARRGPTSSEANRDGQRCCPDSHAATHHAGSR